MSSCFHIHSTERLTTDSCAGTLWHAHLDSPKHLFEYISSFLIYSNVFEPWPSTQIHVSYGGYRNNWDTILAITLRRTNYGPQVKFRPLSAFVSSILLEESDVQSLTYCLVAFVLQVYMVIEPIWPIKPKLYLLSLSFQEMFADPHLRIIS